MMPRWHVMILLGGLASVSTAQPTADPPFRNTQLPLQKRVDDLVGRLTLQEKIGQMQNAAKPIPRLAIPEYNWWNECLHGVARNGVATVFPQSIGMAATWNPDLIEREAEAISTEARAKHHEDARNNRRGIYSGLTFWSPNINITRDPRWGRGQETYGEDPFLTSRIGVAFVKGLQGNDPTYLKVVSTPKHFAVHSGPETMRHSFDARTSKRDLFETYLPAFEATVTEGGAWSVMGAYNRYQGDPCCASDLLLTKILRGTWGFRGYVVSDCGAIWDITNGHQVAKTSAEASAMAVKAGCDLTCGNEYDVLNEAVAKGLITEKEIDQSVRRLMTARFKLGMFDPPEMVPYTAIPFSAVDGPGHDKLALRVAQQSIVLLKNAGQALPLDKAVKSVAVIGPNADDVGVLVGNYNGTPSHPVTILQGIKNKLGTAATVTYARGCDLAEGMVPVLVPVSPKNLKTLDNGKWVSGLTGSYHSNIYMIGQAAKVRVDSLVNFDWRHAAPADGVPADSFSVRWTGKLTADRTGRYTVGVTVDDGCRLFVDDSLFLDDWKDGDTRVVSKETFFKSGEEHWIRLEYYQNRGRAEVRLGWAFIGTDPLEEAIAAAKEADRVILVLGLSPQVEGEEMPVRLKGFSGGDRTDLDLPATQQKLMEAVVAEGKPTVLVLLNGSALAVNWANDRMNAIVEAWYPGQQGGTAVADVLFGDYNPAGRLPVTFYKSVNDLPPFENYDMQGRTYRYFKGQPLYPFGYGLSYTAFEYRNVKVSQANAVVTDTLRIGVTIRNAGLMDGEEVVQLYVTSPSSGAPQAVRSLKGFKRIRIAKGETTTTIVPLAMKVLRQYDEGRDAFVLVPGTYELQLGASSADIRLSASLEVKSP